MHETIGEIELDETYEAKAWHWYKNNLAGKKQKTCFWIVGKHPTYDQIDSYCKGE
jgi:hypothetical protein